MSLSKFKQKCCSDAQGEKILILKEIKRKKTIYTLSQNIESGRFRYERITYSLSASTTIGASFSANQEVVKIKSSDPKF